MGQIPYSEEEFLESQLRRFVNVQIDFVPAPKHLSLNPQKRASISQKHNFHNGTPIDPFCILHFQFILHKMLSVISPAKTLDFDSPHSDATFTRPGFPAPNRPPTSQRSQKIDTPTTVQPPRRTPLSSNAPTPKLMKVVGHRNCIAQQRTPYFFIPIRSTIATRSPKSLPKKGNMDRVHVSQFLCAQPFTVEGLL